MTLRPYPEYRESRIAWLGSIPAGWEVGKFRYVFSESSEVNGSKPVGEMLSVSGYRGVELKVYDDENRKRTDAELETYRVVRPGQLAVNTMWLNYAGLGVSDLTGYVSPAYRSYNISPGVDGRFIHHLMRCGIYVNAYTGELTGIRPNSLQMNRGTLMEWPVLLPPSAEQRQIAEYLDVHTAKIDALIGKQERLIETLAERRQAVISHAVTKGLDPNAPMKDSGVSWLGLVPNNWKVIRVKRTTALITDGAHISPETEDGVYDFVSTRDVSAEGIDFDGALKTSASSYNYLVNNGCQPAAGDVLFSKDGTVGKTVVVEEDRPFVVASSLIIVRPARSIIDSHFLNYLFQSASLQEQIRSFVKGAGLPRLSIANLLKIVGVLPPSTGQQEIVDFLDRETSQIDALSAKAREMIDVLKERRQALISAAVTGKIDVRGLA